MRIYIIIEVNRYNKEKQKYNKFDRNIKDLVEIIRIYK